METIKNYIKAESLGYSLLLQRYCCWFFTVFFLFCEGLKSKIRKKYKKLCCDGDDDDGGDGNLRIRIKEKICTFFK